MTTDQGGSQRGLRANAIGLGGDVIVAVANVAPSSAVAFTLALLLTLTGLASPLVVVIVGALMLCVTLGYSAMNRWRPSAGAPYVWVGEATTPGLGIGTGLLSALGATLFNIGNVTLAGAYLLFVVSPSTTFPKAVTWLIAAAIMGVLLWISIRGLRPSVVVQTALLVIEYVSVITFAILALIHEAGGPAGPRFRRYPTSPSPAILAASAGWLTPASPARSCMRAGRLSPSWARNRRSPGKTPDAP